MRKALSTGGSSYNPLNFKTQEPVKAKSEEMEKMVRIPNKVEGKMLEDKENLTPVEEPPQEEAPTPVPRGVALSKPKRNPVRYGIDETISYALVTACDGPSNVREALEGPEKKEWG